MEKPKSPWSLNPEEEQAAGTALEQSKEEIRQKEAVLTSQRDIVTSTLELIEQKNLVGVAHRNLENPERTIIQTTGNYEFKQIDNYLHELINLSNEMLDNNGITGHIIVIRNPEKRLLEIKHLA